MSLASATIKQRPANPLDLIEDFLVHRDMLFRRASREELSADVPGRWCDLNLYFAWRREADALHFSCAMDLRVPLPKRRLVAELLTSANERLWLGHFDMWSEDGLPMFRYTLPLRGIRGASSEQIEDLTETALIECDRIYPALQFVLWGDKEPAEALKLAMLDTIGEA
ncbi:MAG: YbjN domain-containing protein [Pseudomonadota bacterium]